ncbi:MAG: Iron-utilization periplasmic protein precursor [Planctomycetota bacterium]
MAESPASLCDFHVSRRAFLKSTAFALPAIAATSASLASCASRDGEVVVYISVDDVLARELLSACTNATGVKVLPVFDTEATKTTGLEQRIRAESNRPRADIFWSSEAFATARLSVDGLLRPIPASLFERWPLAHRDPQGRWLAFAARARVVAYRSDREVVVPETWAAFADSSLRANSISGIAIADPRFGTTRGHIAALDAAWSVARSIGTSTNAQSTSLAGNSPTLESWIDGLRANGVRVLSGGNAATVDAVASGEVTFGFTDSDDVFAAQARGLPIAFALPRTFAKGVAGGGTMLVPNTVGLVAGRPERAEVDAVLAWIASAECERLICRSPSRNLPIGPDAATVSAECSAAFSEPDPLAFDVDELAKSADQVAARARTLLERGSEKA